MESQERLDYCSKVDFIHLLANNFTGSHPSLTVHHAPLFALTAGASLVGRFAKFSTPSQDTFVHAWLDQTPSRKLIVNTATAEAFSRTVKPPNTGDVGQVIAGLGAKGRQTQRDGFLSYAEVQEMLTSGRLKSTWLEAQRAPVGHRSSFSSK